MQDLASEIERAALEDLHQAATPEMRSALAIEGRSIGTAFVSIAAASRSALQSAGDAAASVAKSGRL
jgi:hypothetical protein